MWMITSTRMDMRHTPRALFTRSVGYAARFFARRLERTNTRTVRGGRTRRTESEFWWTLSEIRRLPLWLPSSAASLMIFVLLLLWKSSVGGLGEPSARDATQSVRSSALAESMDKVCHKRGFLCTLYGSAAEVDAMLYIKHSKIKGDQI